MSKELYRAEIVNDLQEPLKEPVAEVIPLFIEQSYLELSEEFNIRVNGEYTELEKQEQQRRADFLGAVSCFEYEPPMHDACDEASKLAWDKIDGLLFPDGSALSGDDIRFTFESPEATTETKSELKGIFSKSEQKIDDYAEADELVAEREEFQALLREKYRLEANSYREELEEIARTDNPPVTLNVTPHDRYELDSKVLDELKRIFNNSDLEEQEAILEEREAIKAVELERIKKENKKAKLTAILDFLSQGLDED